MLICTLYSDNEGSRFAFCPLPPPKKKPQMNSHFLEISKLSVISYFTWREREKKNKLCSIFQLYLGLESFRNLLKSLHVFTWNERTTRLLNFCFCFLLDSIHIHWLDFDIGFCCKVSSANQCRKIITFLLNSVQSESQHHSLFQHTSHSNFSKSFNKHMIIYINIYMRHMTYLSNMACAVVVFGG